jgi:glycyl-tRNA synthetase beta chain
LREKLVIADVTSRRAVIEAELGRLEKQTGARVRPDPELLDEVTQLVEYPVGIAGSFDPEFLDVPDEVIVSAMRGHQRYFAMEDTGGALTNRFATIAGTVVRNPAVVVAGNERVLAARLADARFFWDEDRKTDLETLAGKLDSVVYQKKLGTLADKASRIAGLAGWIAEQLGVESDACVRAGRLCKADLLSQVVYEFPDLQGVMGRYYAELGGEPPEVAAAIAEHYLPRGAGGELPGSDTGAVVGVADRVDTVVGGFAARLAPTGSADPFGLRRAALGALAIILERGWSLRLDDLIDRAAAGLEGTIALGPELRGEISEFFTTRLRHVLSELPADCVEAALAAGAADVCDAKARAEALSRLRQRADFEPLAAAFKRVANILKGEQRGDSPDPEAFVEDDERALWSSFSEIKDRVFRHLDGGDYNQALTALAELKAPVDRFFDKVLVIDKENQARTENRLALLGSINATFTRIADFRQLAV